MCKFCFSANPLFTRLLTPILIALILTACGGNEAYIDRGYAPVADAGEDQNITSGTAVTLDGSKSKDDDGDVLSYRWIILEKPKSSNASIKDANTMMPSFTPDVDGIYIIQLTVNDGAVDSKTDQTKIVVGNIVINPPTANAGVDKNSIVGDLVQLDGSGSKNANNKALSFSWKIKAKPEKSTASLSNVGIFNPTITPDKAGEYR